MFLETGFPFPSRRRAPATPEEERSASQAAALRVFLHAADAPERSTGRSAGSLPFMAGMPIAAMPLHEALAILRDKRGPYGEQAFNMAKARLAVAAYSGQGENRERFLPALVELLGVQKVEELEMLLPPPVGTFEWPPDAVRRAAYGLKPVLGSRAGKPGSRARPFRKPPLHEVGCGGMKDDEEVPAYAKDCGGPANGKLPLNEEIVEFDPSTFITTVQFCATSSLPFAALVRLAEPRHWDRNNPMFWRCSKQVVRDAARKEWVLAPPPPDETIGLPWEGTLFEEVDWSWNRDVGVVGAFDVVLNIKTKRFQPSDNNQPGRYEMWFCLHQCLGSMFLGTTMEGGVEVDDGFQIIKPYPGFEKASLKYCICIRKRLRYSNRADRHAYQGPPMSGAFLNLMAPTVVSLWLHGMMNRVYKEEFDRK